MEVLIPTNSATSPEGFAKQNDTIGEDMNLKNLQFLNYLGLKDEMFNGQVMDKVRYLADNLDMNELMNIDFKVGQDPNMPRIDRIYSYMKLEIMSRDKQSELDMINNAKKKWEMQ